MYGRIHRSVLYSLVSRKDLGVLGQMRSTAWREIRWRGGVYGVVQYEKERKQKKVRYII